ncbi:MAG: metallophosphoesterase family protein [Akkermansiaceae bacterium]|nr:metallophosphoesterase family protein [Akkermansiaceae bacterium]
MRVAVLSDIHANAEALEAVLADARAHAAEHYLCLGDIIGFNGDPEACVSAVAASFDAVVRGNHEQALLQRGLFGVPLFTAMMDRTTAMLSAESLAFIRTTVPQLQWQGIELVHASPHRPEQWGRINSVPTARTAFAAFAGQLCFFGHTHRAGVFKEQTPGGTVSMLPAVYRPDGSCEFALEADCRYLVNPGSVGQPRDFDWRAAYAILDTATQTLILRRVEYDVAAAAAKISRTGLPASFAAALHKGTTPAGL